MSLNINALSITGGSGSGGGTQVPPTVANFASLPAVGPFDGALYETIDNNDLYAWNSGLAQWIQVGGTGVALSAAGTASINTNIIASVVSSVLNVSTNAAPANTQGISHIISSVGSTGLIGYFPTGPVTEKTSSVLQITGSGLAVGATLSIQVNQASGSTAGYLSPTDWTTFNSKQSAISVSPGDMLYGSTTSVLANLAIGSTNQVVTSNGFLPVWSTPFAAVPGSVLYVDNNRSDSYTADGTNGKPFKTIAAALSQIITNNNAVNYTVIVNSGDYTTEDINLNNAAFTRIAIVASSVINGAQSADPVPVTSIRDIISTSNNDTLRAILINGFVFRNLSLIGASTGTNFCQYGFIMSNCSQLSSATVAIDIENANQVVFTNYNYAQGAGAGNVTIQNVSSYLVYTSLYSAGTISVITNAGLNKPNGFVQTTTQWSWASLSGTLNVDAGSRATARFSRVLSNISNSGALTSIGANFIGSVTINSGGTWSSTGDIVNNTPTNSGTITQLGKLQASGANLSSLTASSPVLTDANKYLVSGNIALGSQVSGTLPIANGGTNSNTALTNGLVMVSSGGKIVEVAADSSMASNKITSVKDPTSAQDAATKNYVDSVASGLNPLQATYAGSTANVVGTYLNGVGGVGAIFTVTATGAFTIDGTTPPVNSRILIKDQTTGFQNGVYDLTVTGSVGVSPVLTRSLDYNTPAAIDAGDLIPVINGTVNTKTSWLQTAVVTTVGTDALVFVLWTANPANYLLKANNLSDVASANTSLNNILPNQSGHSGEVLSTNGTNTSWTASSGSSTPIITKTTTYTMMDSDRIILIDTSGGTWVLTIPAASASNQNIIYRIKKITSDFNSLTLNGGISTTVDTNNEEIEIINDGTTWQVLSRNGISGTILSTATQVIKGTGSDPTKGTAVIDSAFRWRVGKNLYTQYSFAWSTAGSAGTGSYYFPPPSGLSVDISWISTNFPTTPGSGNVGEGRLSTDNDGQKGFSVAVDTSGRPIFITNEGGAIISPATGNMAQDHGSWTAVWYSPISGWNDV